MRRYPDARTTTFEAVTVLDHPMIFACHRIDRASVPAGMYLYEVRHDDDQQGLPVQIANWIMVNHWGTLISDQPIELAPNASGSNAYRDIDPDEDWNYEGYNLTLQEYLQVQGCPELYPKTAAFQNCNGNWMVDTNVGLMPVEDYKAIRAAEHGFESYEELEKAGYHIDLGTDSKPKNHER